MSGLAQSQSRQKPSNRLASILVYRAVLAKFRWPRYAAKVLVSTPWLTSLKPVPCLSRCGCTSAMPISPAERFEEAVGGHWRASLAHEDMAQPSRLIAPQLAQCTDFDAAQRLYAVVTALAADYLQSAGFEVDLVPLQPHKLGDA